MIRDQEISRLISFAEGMGLEIKFLPRTKNGNAAEWTIDGTEIRIYQTKNESKIGTILSLIHEISHHVWFIHDKNRQLDSESVEALTSDTSIPASKKMRKKLLDMEVAATTYWMTIYKDTNCKFPIWRLNIQMKLDIWMYERYYEDSAFPSIKAARKKYKELVANYEKE